MNSLVCFRLPSVSVKATSRLLSSPFAGSELQRSASGEKTGLLTHGEVARLSASLSGVTRLKTLSGSAALADSGGL